LMGTLARHLACLGGRLRGHDEVDGASSGICVPKRVIVEERITREGRP
jgi:hypothetical protein